MTKEEVIIPDMNQSLAFRFVGKTDQVEGARNGDVIFNYRTCRNEVYYDGEWIPLGGSYKEETDV